MQMYPNPAKLDNRRLSKNMAECLQIYATAARYHGLPIPNKKNGEPYGLVRECALVKWAKEARENAIRVLDLVAQCAEEWERRTNKKHACEDSAWETIESIRDYYWYDGPKNFCCLRKGYPTVITSDYSEYLSLYDQYVEDKHAFDALVERVRAIDEAAADYLIQEAQHKLEPFHYRGDLSHIFEWGASPQGVDYWYSIYLKLINS